MKKTNKILAVILCLCMMASFTALFASAEDEPKTQSVYFGIESIRATKLKEGDPETVLQLEVELSEDDPNEPLPFDTVNTEAEITIYEGYYYYLYGLLGVITEDIKEKATIAKARPVSYEDNILTVDVYSKDGSAGAKMIAGEVEAEYKGETDRVYLNLFEFAFPEGMLKDSVSGAFSSRRFVAETVTGLETKPFKMPSLLMNTIVAWIVGDTKGVIGSTALLVFVLPVELLVLASRANKFYKVYGISAYQMAFDILKNAPKLIFDLKSLYRELH